MEPDLLNDVGKVTDVIESCTTLNQLEVAENMVSNFHKKHEALPQSVDTWVEHLYNLVDLQKEIISNSL